MPGSPPQCCQTFYRCTRVEQRYCRECKVWRDVFCPDNIGALEKRENGFSENVKWAAASLLRRIASGPIARGALGADNDQLHELASSFFVTGTGWFVREAENMEAAGGCTDIELMSTLGADFCTFVQNTTWIAYICPVCDRTI